MSSLSATLEKPDSEQFELTSGSLARNPASPELLDGSEPIRAVSNINDDLNNIIYQNKEEEPVLHWRTYLALAALFMLNYVQLVALNGSSSVLSHVGSDLGATAQQNWIPNALSLVQAVGGPVIAFASDTFQARKTLLVGSSLIAVIGCGIAPGSTNIYRLIVAQILIGCGFASVPLAYAIPSEIVPRKWRPLAQSFINIAATLGAVSGQLIPGYLASRNAHTGWRHFYWIQLGLWAVCVLFILVGYRPPPRHTKLDHLTFWQKIGNLDLPGMALLSAGLTLLLTGLSSGDNPWPWKDARVIGPTVAGFAVLVAFGIYEWRFTKTGIMHHDLFRSGYGYALALVLIFLEGIMLFSVLIFVPAITGALFESDPLLAALRICPFWIASGTCTVGYAFWSSTRRTLRAPLVVGYTLMTAGLVGLAFLQPDASTRTVVFTGLVGVGFAAPLILLVSLVQLTSPHALIATATAVLTSSRAIAAAVFTAAFGAAVSSQTAKWIPGKVPAAAIAAGLDPQYAGQFTGALANQEQAAIAAIPGITPAIIGAGVAALKQALSNSFRVVYIIAASFGVVGIVLCYFVPNLASTMHFGVDAPVEELHSRHHRAADAPVAGEEK